jgi:predicted RNase H-like HicB family nuclease
MPIPPMLGYSISMELIFEVRDAEEGGYYARALGHGIFTEAETWEELRANVLEATSLHFEDGPVHPRLVQLHYVKDELIPVEAA